MSILSLCNTISISILMGFVGFVFEMTIQRRRAKSQIGKLLLKGDSCFKNEGYMLKQNKTKYVHIHFWF